MAALAVAASSIIVLIYVCSQLFHSFECVYYHKKFENSKKRADYNAIDCVIYFNNIADTERETSQDSK